MHCDLGWLPGGGFIFNAASVGSLENSEVALFGAPRGPKLSWKTFMSKTWRSWRNISLALLHCSSVLFCSFPFLMLCHWIDVGASGCRVLCLNEVHAWSFSFLRTLVGKNQTEPCSAHQGSDILSLKTGCLSHLAIFVVFSHVLAAELDTVKEQTEQTTWKTFSILGHPYESRIRMGLLLFSFPLLQEVVAKGWAVEWIFHHGNGKWLAVCQAGMSSTTKNGLLPTQAWDLSFCRL